MRVLAIDPGYGRCGMAVLERPRGGAKDVVLFSTCVETDAKADFAERLNTVVSECARLLEKYRPDSIALEKLYFSTNQKTAMKVAEVRGAILSAAGSAKIKVFEYGPGEVKSAAAGWGGADKRQVATMIRALVKIDATVRLDDEYDAIAIGITHLATHRPSFQAQKTIQ